jgi:hypothetical protein
MNIKKKPKVPEKRKKEDIDKDKNTTPQSKSVTAYKDGEYIAEWSSMTKAADALKMSRVSLKKAISQETPIESLGGAILKL